jgi:hypothetical protein
VSRSVASGCGSQNRRVPRQERVRAYCACPSRTGVDGSQETSAHGETRHFNRRPPSAPSVWPEPPSIPRLPKPNNDQQTLRRSQHAPHGEQIRNCTRRAWWQRQVAEFEASGKSQRQFADEPKLSLASLRHWLHSERKSPICAEPEPVEVQWRTRVELVAAYGDVDLRNAPGTDAAWLAPGRAAAGRRRQQLAHLEPGAEGARVCARLSLVDVG